MIERPGMTRRSFLKVGLARRAALYVRRNDEMPPQAEGGRQTGLLIISLIGVNHE
ncbi:MAG: hypothetical protein ACREXM_06985 [Gammaproteobacteria bacterium]